MLCKLSEADYARGKKWVKEIERQSVVVSEDWLKRYREASPAGPNGTKHSGKGKEKIEPVIDFKLPTPRRAGELVERRRKALAAYQKQKLPLERLFRRCANDKVDSEKFYEELSQHWGDDVGDRLQGKGWEIKGKHSNFQILSRSFVDILEAAEEDRDDLVREEIDRLSKKNIPTRGAFLSEMLCLRFPSEYPVLANPFWEFLRAAEYKAPRRSSEGANFIFLAKALRVSLLHNPEHPAKNLAELDTVIWLAYGK